MRIPRSVAILLFVAVLVVIDVVPARSSGAVEVDLDFAPLNFDYANHTNISPTTPDCDMQGTTCVGMQVGDIVRFNSVAVVGSTVVDAVVTTTVCTDASLTRYEVSQSWASNNEYFKVRQSITAGGMCSYRFDFFVGGTYSGPGTGSPLTLRDVQMTALEIDNRQWVQFSHFDGYTLSADSKLTYEPANKRFQSTNDDGSLDSVPFQVVVTFASLQSVTVGFGRQTSASTNNFALAFEALPFGGRPIVEHGEVVAETPPPIDEGTPVPEIGFSIDPPQPSVVWTTPPSCGVFTSSDANYSTKLTGPVAAGVYVTHCEGGASATFVPIAHIDGALVVNAPVDVATIVDDASRPRFTG